MSQKDQDRIYKMLPQQPVLYHGGLAHIFGLNAALLLGQLLYFQGSSTSNSKGWFYIPARQFRAWLGLSRFKQDEAIELLISLDLLTVKRSHYHGTKTFLVHVDKLESYIHRLRETDKRLLKELANYQAFRNSQTNPKSYQNTYSKKLKHLELLESKKELLNRKGMNNV